VQPLLPGGHFSVDVQRLTRGLFAGEFTASPEPTATAASARAATQSARTLFESIPPMLSPLITDLEINGDAVEVVVCGENGELAIRHQESVFSAWLIRIPEEFSVGQELHLRMVMPPPPGSDHAESVDILGRVISLVDASGDEILHYGDGARIVFAVVKHLGGDLPIPQVSEEAARSMIDALASAPSPIILPPAPGYEENVQPVVPENTQVTGLGLSSSEEVSADTYAAMPSGIIGNISHMSLFDLVQSLSLNRKTARVDVRARTVKEIEGVIFMKDGALVAAGTPANDGKDAFFSLVGAEQGTFRVRYDRHPPEANIDDDTTHLLMEAMRRLDEEQTGIAPAPQGSDLATGSQPWGDAVLDAPQGEPFSTATDSLEAERVISDDDVIEATALLDVEGGEGEDFPSFFEDSLDEDSDVTREEPLRVRNTHSSGDSLPPLTVPSGGGSIFAGFFEEARLASGESPPRSPRSSPTPTITGSELEQILISDEGASLFSGYSDSISSPPS
jgi:hypothetical protein